MSSEVSCQVLDVFFQQLARERRSPLLLLEGVPYPLDHLRRRSARMDWDAFVQFMANTGRVWTPEELERVGESLFDSPALKAFSLVARLLFDARGFYRWVFDKQHGAGDQTFACFENRFEDLAPGELLLELRLKPGYRDCPEFFYVATGNFRGMPRSVGLSAAQVQREWIPGGARYHVRYPEGGGLLPRLKRAVLLPFTAAAVARELKDANTDLQRRYFELSEARSALAAQTERLKIVNRLGRELAAQTDLQGLAAALARVFSEEFPSVGLVVWTFPEEPSALVELCRSGPVRDAPDRGYELASGGERLGRLEVHASKAAGADSVALLDDLVPWISIALGNARSFNLLREYRDQLSLKVEERTAKLNEAMQQLAESLAQQREAIRLRTEFFDNVSHELRTPLTLILLTLESLQRQAPEAFSEQTRQHLDGMQRSAGRLLRLINELLDLAKLGAGKVRLQYEPIELHAFLGALLLPFRVMAEEKGLTLALEGEPGEPVHADAARLDVVFQNLLSNALKFTTEGGIVVRLQRASGAAVVEVQDTGCGISVQDAPHIFERFAQADSAGTRRFGGTGIGLALVKELVDLHGGQIELDSRPGRGATFRVRLPLGTAHIREELRLPPDARREPPDPAPVREPPSRPPPVEPRGKPTTGRRPRVVVVEDDPEIRQLLASMVETKYEVGLAENGEQGLELARRLRPAVIVSDVMMPKMSGVQLLHALRGTPETAEIPVILLTARSDVEARVSGLSDGANDYVAKPFSPRELLARIDTQLRLRDAMARVAQTERLAATSLLTSGFAHEVRNPLNGLMNALAPLKDNLGADGDRELAGAMLEVIEEAGERVRALAESLLSMVRSGGEVTQTVDLGESLCAAQRALAWKTPGTVTLQLRVAEGLTVMGDPAGLGQVWVNLLDNALQAVGRTGRISVEAVSDAEGVQIRFEDDGPGIAPEHLDRLFEPFFTTRAAGQGTGLGLALCQRVVDQHGGAVEASSEPGRGTCFTVRLPRFGPGWR